MRVSLGHVSKGGEKRRGGSAGRERFVRKRGWEQPGENGQRILAGRKKKKRSYSEGRRFQQITFLRNEETP